MNKFLLLVLLAFPFLGFGQNYSSYFIGNPVDMVTSASGGICLMGGASEDDNASRWFLQRANGGDVLVLRTTGSDGYNSYFYSELGVSVNSVETIVCHNPAASSDPYVLQKIQQAEAIWFAGGNQWTYISYWRDTPLQNAINQAISERNIVIGGTSAGMAIQGKYYFSAQNGTVTSSNALANPFNNQVTVDSSEFINNPFLESTITDTHFDNPDRKGRLVTFLARIKENYDEYATAIACDEYTAVCIDENGIARVFGSFPTFNDNAYFVQSNCELEVRNPENITSGNPLTWNLNGLAIKAYQIKGDITGSKTFDLNNWQSGSGGTWNNWSVVNGVFFEQIGSSIDCLSLSINDLTDNIVSNIYPNPTKDNLIINVNNLNTNTLEINLYNILGKKFTITTVQSGNQFVADLSELKDGIYFLKIEEKEGKKYVKKIIKE